MKARGGKKKLPPFFFALATVIFSLFRASASFYSFKSACSFSFGGERLVSVCIFRGYLLLNPSGKRCVFWDKRKRIEWLVFFFQLLFAMLPFRLHSHAGHFRTAKTRVFSLSLPL